MGLALYVHVPFCLRKCAYCDFVSFAGVERAVMKEYARALAAEVSYWATLLGPPVELTSVYVGGGTPTVWPVSCWRKFWTAITEHFHWQRGIEVTVEANPGTVNRRLLATLKGSGVNRLSLGAQSFNDHLLSRAGRLHNAREVAKAVALARACGFTNISLDLIYGLPDQSASDWCRDLEAALSLQPTHLSCYELQLSPQVPWAAEVAEGRLHLPSEEERADMFQYTCRRLAAAGFEHYEISNWARPGYICRHNLVYWLRLPYLGIGVAACSFMGERRWSNTPSLEAYLDVVCHGRLAVCQVENLTLRDAMAETLFLGLRLRRGVDLKAFERSFGCSVSEVYAKEVAALQRDGLIEEREGTLRLTERGLLLGNVAFRAFV